ncbi:hypothetical protein AXG93_4694s1000 [Marchantia polymorpha subsp. ruderalis]|uniref:Uncharacterized protein n=1 Tax=Marchantia polymorpha subsp. ruderalis TaxID=1480154 RepID=A0A176WC32_MARPO|nr:hypothetical protein AXG93_4694s1000 [Marchantia polymorpha subsp. ruderalis]
MKERQLQETEAKYEVLRKGLTEQVEKQRYSEKTCEGLCEDIEVETQKWLQLRDLERRATAMIKCSVSGQRQLARKLDAFLTSSCEAMSNLELELTVVLRRLGLDQKSDGKAIANSADVMLVQSSHQSV